MRPITVKYLLPLLALLGCSGGQIPPHRAPLGSTGQAFPGNGSGSSGPAGTTSTGSSSGSSGSLVGGSSTGSVGETSGGSGSSASSSGSSCVAVGADCSNSDCCSNEACVNYGPGQETCETLCNQDSDCQSGCCVPLTNGQHVCVASSYCGGGSATGSSSGGGSCVGSGGSCASTVCCGGEVCVNYGSGQVTCSATCSQNSDCQSGCCGTLANGQKACVPASYCGGGSTTGSSGGTTSGGSTSGGNCSYAGGPGCACQSYRDCYTNSSGASLGCYAGICKYRGDLGDPCSGGVSDCTDGLYCDWDSNSCQPQVTSGQPCHQDDQCHALVCENGFCI